MPSNQHYPDNKFFPGFRTEQIKTSEAAIHTVYGGNRDGPPLLLLHGIPETHVLWRKVAPALAHNYFVVVTDLRGYGDSSKPHGGDGHAAYSKRAMAQDQIEVMQHLGFAQFALVGHDRGGRVAHRLALDHPGALTKLAIRAPASIDLVHDKADLDRKIECPLLVLWSEKGPFHRMYDVLQTWEARAVRAQGRAMPTGHFLPEQMPHELVQEITTFLSYTGQHET